MTTTYQGKHRFEDVPYTFGNIIMEYVYEDDKVLITRFADGVVIVDVA